jgi:hypothetical protein
MSDTHISAMGKKVDMAALRAKNERVRAVGNMNVNARGDIIDSNDEVIEDGTKRVNEFYMKSVMNRGTRPTGFDTAPAPTMPTTPAPDTQYAAVKMPQIDTQVEPFEQIQLTSAEAEFDAHDEDILKDLPQTSRSGKHGSSK